MTIGKKIPVDKKLRGKSKAARITDTGDYCADPEKKNNYEKLLYKCTRNFLSTDHDSQIKEMIALAESATRSSDTCSHYVFSFKEDEHPTPAQIEEAANIVMEELGFTGCQAIVGAHKDTDNDHIHLFVNRVDPVTGKMRKAGGGGGFEYDAIHRALARIDHIQGWKPEAGARYKIDAAGNCVRSFVANPDAPKKPSTKALDHENRTGLKSAERIGIEFVEPILRAATSWRDLHDQLAKQGVEYRQHGSGAVVIIDGQPPIKASAVGRAAGFNAMQKRLGPFMPSTQENENVYRTHSAIEKLDALALSNRSGNHLRVMSQCHLADRGNQAKNLFAGVLLSDARDHGRVPGALRREPTADADVSQRNAGRVSTASPRKIGRDDRVGAENIVRTIRGSGRAHERAVGTGAEQYQRELTEYQTTYAGARAALKAGHAEQRATLESGLSLEKRVLKAVVADLHPILQHVLLYAQGAHHHVQRMDLRTRLAVERELFAEQWPPALNFEDWQRMRGRPDLAEAWRARSSQVQMIVGIGESVSTTPDRDPFAAVRRGTVTDYVLSGQRVPAFTDYGRRVEIAGWRDTATTLAALRLSGDKWPSGFLVTGTDEYKAIVVELAAKHGLKVVNPELAGAIASAMTRIEGQRAVEAKAAADKLAANRAWMAERQAKDAALVAAQRAAAAKPAVKVVPQPARVVSEAERHAKMILDAAKAPAVDVAAENARKLAAFHEAQARAAPVPGRVLSPTEKMMAAASKHVSATPVPATPQAKANPPAPVQTVHEQEQDQQDHEDPDAERVQ